MDIGLPLDCWVAAEFVRPETDFEEEFDLDTQDMKDNQRLDYQSAWDMDTELGFEDIDWAFDEDTDREDYCTGQAVMLDEDTEGTVWGVVGSQTDGDEEQDMVAVRA